MHNFWIVPFIAWLALESNQGLQNNPSSTPPQRPQRPRSLMWRLFYPDSLNSLFIWTFAYLCCQICAICILDMAGLREAHRVSYELWYIWAGIAFALWCLQALYLWYRHRFSGNQTTTWFQTICCGQTKILGVITSCIDAKWRFINK